MKLTAQKVPYSSVVGQSVVLKNEHGVVVAQLSILLAGSKERQIQFADAIVSAFGAGDTLNVPRTIIQRAEFELTHSVRTGDVDDKIVPDLRELLK